MSPNRYRTSPDDGPPIREGGEQTAPPAARTRPPGRNDYRANPEDGPPLATEQVAELPAPPRTVSNASG